jgi:hypothetical protein
VVPGTPHGLTAVAAGTDHPGGCSWPAAMGAADAAPRPRAPPRRPRHHPPFRGPPHRAGTPPRGSTAWPHDLPMPDEVEFQERPASCCARHDGGCSRNPTLVQCSCRGGGRSHPPATPFVVCHHHGRRRLGGSMVLIPFASRWRGPPRITQGRQRRRPSSHIHFSFAPQSGQGSPSSSGG